MDAGLLFHPHRSFPPSRGLQRTFFRKLSRHRSLPPPEPPRPPSQSRARPNRSITAGRSLARGIEIQQLPRVRRPGWPLFKEPPCPLAQPPAQLLISAQEMNRLRNRNRIRLRQYPRLFSVPDLQPQVGGRQDHRPAGGEKLRKLARQPIVVEHSWTSRLHQ